MDQGSGFNSYACPESIDRTRVLVVPPLRCLVPVFVDAPGAPLGSNPGPTPFTCLRPTGPYPPGVQPFYPFLAWNDTFNPSVAPNYAYQGPPVASSRLGGSAFYPSVANVRQGPPVAPNPPGGSAFYPSRANSHQGPPFGIGGGIPNPILSDSFMVPISQANEGAGGCQGTHQKPIILDDDTYGESFTQNAQHWSGLGAHGNEIDIASSTKKKRGRPKKKMATENVEEINVEPVISNFLTAFKLTDIDKFKRSCNDREFVRTIQLVYDLIRRKLFQSEEANNNSISVVTRRHDLKVGAVLLANGVRANIVKRIGHVPGIEVGDIFYFRMELCVVGLHAPSMAGIDCMTVKTNMEEEMMAISIVSSGGYEDKGDDAHVLIYSGQGGVQRKDGLMFDQKLEKGNLALEKSYNHDSDVRVIRGVKNPDCPSGKIYIYDGLYKIHLSWSEKNDHNCNVFKYMLVRVPGQPEAFSMWKSIQQWKDGNTVRPGIILPDLSAGAENQPVAVVNDVDGEMGPSHFTYIPSLKYTEKLFISKPFVGCNCVVGCIPGHLSCTCTLKNGGLLPYSQLGIVLTDKSLIHECGPSCRCPPECRNRVSQAGVKVRLEVFKTTNRGWGLRSWDPIRAGGFICEYAGDVVEDFNAEYFWRGVVNDFIFDLTRYYEPQETVHGKSAVDGKDSFSLVISAKKHGNVARFMNHSCSPTVYWKAVMRESNNVSCLHVAFFAICHIPPLQELTFDYGIVPPERGSIGRKTCLCGSGKCRGYFY